MSRRTSFSIFFVSVLACLFLISCSTAEPSNTNVSVSNLNDAQSLDVSTGLLGNTDSAYEEEFTVSIHLENKSGDPMKFREAVNVTVALISSNGSIVYRGNHSAENSQELVGFPPSEGIRIPFSDVSEVSPGETKHRSQVSVRHDGEVIAEGVEETSSQPTI